MDNYIYLIYLLIYEIILLVFVWRKFGRSIFSPSFYTISMFIVSTLLCLYCKDYWKIVFYPETFWLVSLGLTSVVLAENYAHETKKPIKKIQICLICIPQWIKIVLSIYSVVATLLYLNEIWKIGLAHSMMIGEAIASVKEDYSYYENQFNPIIRQGYKFVMAIAYIYTYVFINNYCVCKQKFRSSFWYIIPLFSAVCINLISGSRGDMLRMVLLFLFAYYICVWQKNDWKRQPTKQILKIAIPSLAIMLFVFFSARLFVKVNIETQERIGGPVEYLSYYIASPLQVLNIHTKQISNNPEANSQVPFAYCTMNGIYDFLKKNGIINKNEISTPKVGFGFAYVGGDSNAAGNVDTFFSQSKLDFGIIGMCIYTIIIYFLISKYFYRHVLYKDFSCISVRRFIKFSFFFYIVEMSFYADCTGQILSQTGILQYICLLILIHFLIVPKYFKPIIVK